MLGDIKVYKTKTSSIMGLSWWLINPKTQEIYSITSQIIRDGNFILRGEKTKEDYANYGNLLNGIISTFRFLE